MYTIFRALVLTASGALVAALAACSDGPAPDAGQSRLAASPARNVILFIGDGMGISTVTAARIFDGQSQGMPGEEHALVFETFPNVALVKTYNTNQQVPDSAGTATAMMTGEKTRAGVINVGPQARRRNCEEALAHPLSPLGVQAKQQGKAVGVVTTTRLTHATPATVFAHTPERDWESDQYMPASAMAQGCRDLAYQLAHFDVGGGLDVVLGGGRAEFQGSDRGGNRQTAGEDLIQSWLSAAPGRTYVSTSDELDGVTQGQQVLGIFSRSHMTYVAEREQETAEPTLTDMTIAAIDLLSQQEDGFFLLVEGGRIDHGHHDGKPGYALLEAQAFARAIEAALEKVDLEDTLILVTADHSHVFTMSGYPVRGNPILGLVTENDENGEPRNTPAVDATGTPYTSLGYANGPGAVGPGSRPLPEVGIGAVYQSLIPVERPQIDGSLSHGETHAGEDVALYGIGAGSDRVRGVIEQSLVYDIMLSAFGWQQ